MKRIFIVGGSGFARECYFNLLKLPEYGKEIEFGGFLGQGGHGENVDYKSLQKFYLGDLKDFEFRDNDYCIIGAGMPDIRKTIVEELKEKNAKFFNLIYPAPNFPEEITIGEGNVILYSFISVNVKVGDYNVLNGDIRVGHDVVIGNNNFFGPNVQVLGSVIVGNNNQIGTSTIILPNAKIGNNNVIAPLSAVYLGCKDNCYMMGNHKKTEEEILTFWAERTKMENIK